MRCHIGDCPTGVATQVSWRQQGLAVNDKAERVARFQHETVEALREIVVSMGLADPWSIGPMDLFQRPNSTLAMPFDRVYDFLKPGELAESPDTTPYARAWKQAQAESFERLG